MPPDFIDTNWTDELLGLMFQKMRRRYERENKAASTTTPDEDLFSKMNLRVESVN